MRLPHPTLEQGQPIVRECVSRGMLEDPQIYILAGWTDIESYATLPDKIAYIAFRVGLEKALRTTMCIDGRNQCGLPVSVVTTDICCLSRCGAI